MAAKVKLTIEEQINRAKAGRSQTYIVNQMRLAGLNDLTEVTFSRKKKGHEEFTEKELEVLSEVLGEEISFK